MTRNLARKYTDIVKFLMRQHIKKIILKTNPVWWLLLIVTLLLAGILLSNYDDITFEEIDFFTFLWTYTLLLVIHTLLNFTHFVKFSRSDRPDKIYRSYMQLTILYLPYLIIAIIYENLYLFSDLFNHTFSLIDPTLMQIDKKIFGLQPTIWLQQFTHPLMVDFFMISYSMFIVYPFFYLIYLFHKNQLEIFQKVIFAQILALTLSLTSFIIFPAMGPRFTLDPVIAAIDNTTTFYTVNLEGISSSFVHGITGRESLYAAQVDLWNYIERVRTDCMPSMHTGLCLISLFYALKHRDLFVHKQLALWFWIIGVSALIISTVYLRYHWVIDVIAGAVLAIVVYYLTNILFTVWKSNRQQAGLKEQAIP
jgi:membrane-associated phospholipid phosphatase